MEEPVKVHKAQAMCYGYIYGVQEGLSKIGIQMTYANLETEVVKRFREVISICLLYTSSYVPASLGNQGGRKKRRT